MQRSEKTPFVSTVDYVDHAEFIERARILPPPTGSLWDDVRAFGATLASAKTCRAMLIQSSSGRLHPDIFAAILMGFWSRAQRPAIVMMGCMWQKDPGLAGWLQKQLLRLADRAIVRYAPQSTDELPIFAAAWEVPLRKLRFVPYFYTLTEQQLAEASAPDLGTYIFSGGNSHRDYETLLKVCEALPEHRFVIASDLLDGRPVPPNVRAGRVPHREFVGLLRSAAAVVVPIRRGLTRATAQQTYLNAMVLGKPTIITDSLGVRDHVQDGRTALVVDGSPESFVAAIRRVFDPAHRTEMLQLGAQARETVLRDFTFEKHCDRLLEILDEAVDEYFAVPAGQRAVEQA